MSSRGDEQSWRDTILAGLAKYIDAGSIVAGSVALGLIWAPRNEGKSLEEIQDERGARFEPGVAAARG